MLSPSLSTHLTSPSPLRRFRCCLRICKPWPPPSPPPPMLSQHLQPRYEIMHVSPVDNGGVLFRCQCCRLRCRRRSSLAPPAEISGLTRTERRPKRPIFVLCCLADAPPQPYPSGIGWLISNTTGLIALSLLITLFVRLLADCLLVMAESPHIVAFNAILSTMMQLWI